MKHNCGDVVEFDGGEYMISQVKIRAKDGGKDITLKEVIEPSETHNSEE